MRTPWLSVVFLAIALRGDAAAPTCCSWVKDCRSICMTTDCASVRELCVDVCGAATPGSAACETVETSPPPNRAGQDIVYGLAGRLPSDDKSGWQPFRLSSLLQLGYRHLEWIYMIPPADCLGAAGGCPINRHMEIVGHIEWRAYKRAAQHDVVQVPVLVAEKARSLEPPLGRR